MNLSSNLGAEHLALFRETNFQQCIFTSLIKISITISHKDLSSVVTQVSMP